MSAAPSTSSLPRASVLYSVYRPLIKLAPSEQLKEHIRQAFRRNTKLTQMAKINRQVDQAQQMLSEFRRLPTSQTLQTRYSQLTAHLASLNALHSPGPTLRARLRAHRLLPAPEPPQPHQTHQTHKATEGLQEHKTEAPHRSKPHLTPGIIHSTLMNPPLSRLKPQPLSTSMMIFRRRQAQQRRIDRRVWVDEWVRDGREEDRFEAQLAQAGAGGNGRGRGAAGKGWGWEWRQEQARLANCQEKEWRRNELKVPRALTDVAVEANRRREGARASRGRARGTPPRPNAEPQ